MTLTTFTGCKIQYTGILTAPGADGTPRQVVIATGGKGVLTFQVDPAGSTYSTAVITVRRGNVYAGPFYDLEDPITIPINGGMTAAIDCAAIAFVALEVTTAEGSDKKVNVTACHHEGGFP